MAKEIKQRDMQQESRKAHLRYAMLRHSENYERERIMVFHSQTSFTFRLLRKARVRE